MARCVAVLLAAFLFSLIGDHSFAQDNGPGPETGTFDSQRPASLATKSSASSKEKSEAEKQEEYYELFEVLVDTVDQIERNYVEPIDRRELLEAAIEGMLSKLDVHSNYVTPDDVDEFRTSVENEFGGIGITVSVRQGQLMVVSPMVGTPAHRAGVRSGDRIVEIDGKSTEKLRLDDAVKMLKGRVGTSVKLGVRRIDNPDKQEFEITRAAIQLDSVHGPRRRADQSWDFMLSEAEGVGYIQVSSFTSKTATEVQSALNDLKRRNVKGLVLDLRFNPGGLLTSAVEVCDMFVNKGDDIVSTKGRNIKPAHWRGTGKGKFSKLPVAVLINRYSASASEIVSACLQDHHRAVVIGERSWGKGSVQNVINLEDGKSVLMLTTASYHRPSGKNIHRFPDSKESDDWGVRPDKDYEIALTPEETVQVILTRRRRERLPTGEAGQVDGNGAGFVDRQLQKAREYLAKQIAAQDAA